MLEFPSSRMKVDLPPVSLVPSSQRMVATWTRNRVPSSHGRPWEIPPWNVSVPSLNHFQGGGNSNISSFHPYLGKISSLTHILQMGWFNHQPVLVWDVEWFYCGVWKCLKWSQKLYVIVDGPNKLWSKRSEFSLKWRLEVILNCNHMKRLEVTIHRIYLNLGSASVVPADSDSVVPADSVSVVPAAHPLVLSMLKSVLLLTCTLSSPPHLTPPFCLKYPQVCLAPYVIIPTPPHPTPPFGLIYAQVCLAPDLYFIIPTPPHPCRYNWAQIFDFVGTSETNTCRYKWVKSVGASEPLPFKVSYIYSLHSILYIYTSQYILYIHHSIYYIYSLLFQTIRRCVYLTR